jgi:hypothetical protein
LDLEIADALTDVLALTGRLALTGGLALALSKSPPKLGPGVKVLDTMEGNCMLGMGRVVGRVRWGIEVVAGSNKSLMSTT